MGSTPHNNTFTRTDHSRSRGKLTLNQEEVDGEVDEAAGVAACDVGPHGKDVGMDDSES